MDIQSFFADKYFDDDGLFLATITLVATNSETNANLLLHLAHNNRQHLRSSNKDSCSASPWNNSYMKTDLRQARVVDILGFLIENWIQLLEAEPTRFRYPWQVEGANVC
ncbi:hypothetical protein OUZ56_030813 [Daphnia magna]|uniref:Uncharacterized protein n=1 Tax=Daphnia magna TaxID=35525 RepID=A0ABQ9ZSK4_9CRUS|nr:hypothetical protein OUZ56_030813 [Daphnia magna]